MVAAARLSAFPIVDEVWRGKEEEAAGRTGIGLVLGRNPR